VRTRTQRSDSVVLAKWDPQRPLGAGGERQGMVVSAEDGDRGLVCRWALESDDRPGDIPDGRSVGMELVGREGVHVGHDDGRGSQIPSSNGSQPEKVREIPFGGQSARSETRRLRMITKSQLKGLTNLAVRGSQRGS
jgi:hypothetical protein